MSKSKESDTITLIMEQEEQEVTLFLELFGVSDGKNTVPVNARQPNNA